MQWDYKVRQAWITNCDEITKRDGFQSHTVQGSPSFYTYRTLPKGRFLNLEISTSSDFDGAKMIF